MKARKWEKEIGDRPRFSGGTVLLWPDPEQDKAVDKHNTPLHSPLWNDLKRQVFISSKEFASRMVAERGDAGLQDLTLKVHAQSA